MGLFQSQDLFHLWFFFSENLVIPPTAITLTTTKHTDRCSPFQAVISKIFVSNINKLLLLPNNLWLGIVENLTGIREKKFCTFVLPISDSQRSKAKPSV